MSGLLTPAGSALGLNMVGPVNRMHPLNRGLKAWWLCLPGMMGGSRLLDLTNPSNQGNYGTLTNMEPHLDWATAYERSGGFGSLDFGGTNEYVDCGPVPEMGSLAQATLLCWVRKGVEPSYGFVIGIGTTGDTHRLGMLTQSGVLYFVQNGDFPSVAESVLPLNVWTQVAVVFIGGTSVTGYVNGVQVAQGTTTIAATLSTTAQMGNMSIGRFMSGGGLRYMTGQVDDVRIYDRALSAFELLALRENSMLGYPGTLNRIGDYSSRIAEAPATGNRRRRVLMGAA